MMPHCTRYAKNHRLCILVAMEGFRRRVILSIGIIAGSFVAFVLLAWLFSNSIHGIAGEVAEARRLMAERTTTIESIADLKKQQPAAEEVLAKINVLLPHRDELISFSDFLDRLSRSHAVGLNFAFAGGPVEPTPSEPGHVPFSLALSGSSRDIAQFLADLEFKSTRFLANFDSVVLSQEGDAYRAEVKGKVYFR